MRGLDLINGTPVVDIKPYLPQFENIGDAKVPKWVEDSYEVPRIAVAFSDKGKEEMDELTSRKGFVLRPFADVESLTRALEETLSLDIRSPFQKDKHKAAKVFQGDLFFHSFRVGYELKQSGDGEPLVEVMSVENAPAKK